MEDRDILELLASMKPRGKAPHSAGVLDSWIDHAESDFGIPSSGRVRWLIATTVVAAMLQTEKRLFWTSFNRVRMRREASASIPIFGRRTSSSTNTGAQTMRRQQHRAASN